eukprot:gene12966-biopygen302
MQVRREGFNSARHAYCMYIPMATVFIGTTGPNATGPPQATAMWWVAVGELAGCRNSNTLIVAMLTGLRGTGSASLPHPRTHRDSTNLYNGSLQCKPARCKGYPERLK